MKTYPTKVDWWMYGALSITPIGGAFALLTGVLKGQELAIFMGAGALVFYGALMGGLVIPIRYTITADELQIRAGLQRLRIPWDRLISAERSSNPMSSPALSLTRIAIAYKKPNGREASVLISPPDRDQFLEDLKVARGGGPAAP